MPKVAEHVVSTPRDPLRRCAAPASLATSSASGRMRGACHCVSAVQLAAAAMRLAARPRRNVEGRAVMCLMLFMSSVRLAHPSAGPPNWPLGGSCAAGAAAMTSPRAMAHPTAQPPCSADIAGCQCD